MPDLVQWFPHHLLSVVNFLLTLVFVSFILKSKRPPGSTLAWLFFIFLIPYIGIPFYIFLSSRKFNTRLQRKEALFTPKERRPPAPGLHTVETILENLGSPPPRLNAEAELITSGTTAFNKLSQLISSAENSINLTTFIFADDEVGCAILSLLTKKASEGIAVRLLLDSLGSFWVKHPSFSAFKNAGGKIGYFMPVIHVPFKGRSNLRNHRKILVVDSELALLGGMNIAEEYMGPNFSSARWVDLAMSIRGDAVHDLLEVFKKDWNFATGEKINETSNPLLKSIETPLKNYRIQVVASGPDVTGDPLYDTILTLLFKAQKRIWIATPYFIPDESLAKALHLAAIRGVEVRILVPKKSNHFFADIARGSYLKQLCQEKCKIFYFPKMLHAKALLIDSDYALIGSANFDMRSLLYNYEIGSFLTSGANLSTLSNWFESRFPETSSALPKTGFWIEILEGVGRVLGPLI